MRFYLLLFLLNGIVFHAQAQQSSDTLKIPKDQEAVFEEPPITYGAFPGGGNSAAASFIDKNLIYPADALENKITGNVYVQFTIEKDGSVSDIKVVRCLYDSCDQAAIDVVSKFPQWIPATISNIPVKSKKVVRVKFRLS